MTDTSGVNDVPADLSVPVEHPKSAPDDRAENGPLDEAEANAVRPYVDLGGVKILPRQDLRVRLEVEEGSKRVVAVALDFQDSSLQVQPFAAPRNSGLWHEIREQIAKQIAQQGGTTTPRPERSGPSCEPSSRPAAGPGRSADRPVHRRRWAALVPAWRDLRPRRRRSRGGCGVEDLFRSIVVVRGATPMPPRDLIPLHVHRRRRRQPRAERLSSRERMDEERMDEKRPTFREAFARGGAQVRLVGVNPGETPSGAALLGAVGGIRGPIEAILPGLGFPDPVDDHHDLFTLRHRAGRDRDRLHRRSAPSSASR